MARRIQALGAFTGHPGACPVRADAVGRSVAYRPHRVLTGRTGCFLAARVLSGFGLSDRADACVPGDQSPLRFSSIGQP